MKRWKKGWWLLPGRWLYWRCPKDLQNMMLSPLRRHMEKLYSGSEKRVEEKCQVFLWEELSILIAGIAVFFILVVGFLWHSLEKPEEILLQRNSFGQGSQEYSLVLSDGEEREELVLQVEEQRLTKKQREAVFQSFFQDLKKQMCGENISLQRVNRPLCLEDTLPSYPFSITYDPEDLSCICLDGSLGEKAKNLKEEEKLHTGIQVTAVYGEYEESRRIPITLVAAEKHIPTMWEKIETQLKKEEESSRDRKTLRLSSRAGKLWIEEEKNRYSFQIGCVLLALPLFLIVHRYEKIKTDGEKSHEAAERDFAVIVHQLTLYMGDAGLSFASAVHRMSAEYTRTHQSNTESRAFGEILWMDQQMRMGAGQREVCQEWGIRMKEERYRKLSVALTQILSKGTKEARQFLEDMEKEAFQERVDRAREEGERASTRLLFPMIVLLCLSMTVILFPAVVSFQQF